MTALPILFQNQTIKKGGNVYYTASEAFIMYLHDTMTIYYLRLKYKLLVGVKRKRYSYGVSIK
jgi:hypothetical protein